MTNPDIYQGTVKVPLRLTVACDLVTGVASVAIAVRKPSGVEATWTPNSVTYVEPTSTISYETETGDLTECGVYHLQPIVTMTSGAIWLLGAVAWDVLQKYEVP